MCESECHNSPTFLNQLQVGHATCQSILFSFILKQHGSFDVCHGGLMWFRGVLDPSLSHCPLNGRFPVVPSPRDTSVIHALLFQLNFFIDCQDTIHVQFLPGIIISHLVLMFDFLNQSMGPYLSYLHTTDSFQSLSVVPTTSVGQRRHCSIFPSRIVTPLASTPRLSLG